MNWQLSFSAALALLASLGWAQVQVKGRFQETVQMVFYQKADPFENLKVIQPSARVNNDQLILQEMMSDKVITKPYKFAESVEINLDINEAGSWSDQKSLQGVPLKIWQAIVSSEEAVSLSLQFEQFKLPEGAEFYINSRDYMLGAFTAQVNNKEDLSFSTVPIAGDFLGLALAIPDTTNGPEEFKAFVRDNVKFKVNRMAHGFRGFPPTKNYQDSGSCNIDVACETSPNYEKQIRSVAMLVTADGTRFCSGTMINNTLKNKRQLFLTANHCMWTTPTNFVAIFNYQLPSCNSTEAPEPSTIQSASGMKLLSSWAPSDFALLEIVESIPNSYNVFLSGWSNSRAAPSNVFGIHHPSCDVKKITFYNGTTIADSWDEAPRRLHWKIPKWTRGTTEPGSSGSGLFNSKGQVVGQLHGGLASCGNPDGFDIYGALAHSWNGGLTTTRRLREFLAPRGIAPMSIDGIELQK